MHINKVSQYFRLARNAHQLPNSSTGLKTVLEAVVSAHFKLDLRLLCRDIVDLVPAETWTSIYSL